MAADLQAALDWLDTGVSGYASRFRGYLEGLDQAETSESISPAQRCLVRFALALTIPHADLAAQARHEARAHASADEIKQAACIAANLRAGAAIAYGRLAFKMLDASAPSVTTAAEQIKADREYMTHLRRGSAEDFDRLLALFAVSHRAALPLSKQTQELIAIGCATITQCVYCMEVHVKAAKDSGVTMKQISQAVHLAIAMRMEATLMEVQPFG